MGVFRSLKNLQLSDKYENLLKEMCWNDAYLVPGLDGQYVVNFHNNSTHISSVAMHVEMVDVHTLSPCSCQLLLHIYDSHAASQSFNMSQIGDYPFHQT